VANKWDEFFPSFFEPNRTIERQKNCGVFIIVLVFNSPSPPPPNPPLEAGPLPPPPPTLTPSHPHNQCYESGSGSGSRRVKMTHEKVKKFSSFEVLDVLF